MLPCLMCVCPSVSLSLPPSQLLWSTSTGQEHKEQQQRSAVAPAGLAVPDGNEAARHVGVMHRRQLKTVPSSNKGGQDEDEDEDDDDDEDDDKPSELVLYISGGGRRGELSSCVFNK